MQTNHSLFTHSYTKQGLTCPVFEPQQLQTPQHLVACNHTPIEKLFVSSDLQPFNNHFQCFSHILQSCFAKVCPLHSSLNPLKLATARYCIAEMKRTREEPAAEEQPRRSGRARKQVQPLNIDHEIPATPLEPVNLSAYKPAATCARSVVPSFDPSEGSRDKHGRLVFKDFPHFRPNLTPQQVIQAGSFGGVYFNPKGGKPGIKGPSVDITHKEFPADWFEGLQPKQYRARIYTFAVNKYGVKAGQDQAFWEEKGWIDPQDPRGWFHWYCRFYQGRRMADDARQISRWKGVIGDKGRWLRALVNKIVRANKRYDDASVSPVIRQTLLHWAFELTESEFEAMLKQL